MPLLLRPGTHTHTHAHATPGDLTARPPPPSSQARCPGLFASARFIVSLPPLRRVTVLLLAAAMCADWPMCARSAASRSPMWDRERVATLGLLWLAHGLAQMSPCRAWACPSFLCHHVRTRCDAALLPLLDQRQSLRRIGPSRRRWLAIYGRAANRPERVWLFPQRSVACRDCAPIDSRVMPRQR